jgi:hypothetical protein
MLLFSMHSYTNTWTLYIYIYILKTSFGLESMTLIERGTQANTITYIYVCMYVFICMYVYVYVFICLLLFYIFIFLYFYILKFSLKPVLTYPYVVL